MVRIHNATGQHWGFGSLQVPVGTSEVEDSVWADAYASTAIKDYVWPAYLHPGHPLRYERYTVAEVVTPEPEDEAPHQGRELKAHTRAELEEIADNLGLEHDAKTTKRQLLALIASRSV